MDLIKVKMTMEIYESLTKELRSQMEVEYIEPINYDYQNNTNWLKAKEASSEAYKNLKKIEFDLRHK